MEILKVQNLCKTYGTGEAKVDALKNVSFSLEKGEFVIRNKYSNHSGRLFPRYRDFIEAKILQKVKGLDLDCH